MMLIDSLLEKLTTGSGFWHPSIWIVLCGFILLFLYVVRMFGRTDYKKNTDQEQPFLSGNIDYTSDQTHVKASNLYWGFFSRLHSVFAFLKRIHTGDIRDYVIWFMLLVSVLFIILEVI